MQTITLELRSEDAEPILRKAAYDAALYGGRVDYVPRQCWHQPFGGFRYSYDEAKAKANQYFRAAKRLVEAFGVEYEPTTEAETMTEVGAEYLEQVRSKVRARYRDDVHTEAAKQAADRVVRSWRATLKTAKAA